MGDLSEPNVAVSPPSASSNSSPWLVGPERWEKAEKATRKIICQFQPTAVSEQRRREVIAYVQRLIRGYLGFEVFPYGSVPLKTYLPDGDIDLTAFGSASVEDCLIDDIAAVLEGEEHNRAAEFVVKDVQIIRAEVKLVKCIVQNIVVDISFNQIGGLCTLCFLEQVDRLIGNDHLFKQSIILIKSWCYYESRILGAHHGLISTYALETMVLYIFHVFHTTLDLDGPLAVLYKFLDYFSSFDWDIYCISLIGPVRTSALPEIVAEIPENGGDLLLGSDFLRYCADMFSVPSKSDGKFLQKHLNIIDPLKGNNNLGRSVSKGNFYRIRSAFALGARQLGRILVEPGDDIANELFKFFSNTLDRHGSGQRPDVEDSIPRSTLRVYAPAFSIPVTESCHEEIISGFISSKCIGTERDCKQNPYKSSKDEIENSEMLSDDENRAKGSGIFGNRFSGDAKDLSTPILQALKISDDSPKISTSSGEESVSPVGIPYHAPHLYFTNSKLRNAKMENGNLDTKQSESSENIVSSTILRAANDEQVNVEVLTSVGSKSIHSAPSPVACTTSSESNCSNLSGDYNSQFICLQYGRWCYDYASSASKVTTPSPPPSHFQSMNFWDPIQHLPPHHKRNGFPNGSVNGSIHSPVFYPINQMLIPGVAFGSEEFPKQRGTGTYFPNTNRPPHGYRPSTVRGRNHGQARSPRSNGLAYPLSEANTHERSYMDHSPSQFRVDQGGGTPKSLDANSSRRKLNPNANGFVPQPSLPQTSSEGLPSPGIQRPKPVFGMDRYGMS